MLQHILPFFSRRNLTYYVLYLSNFAHLRCCNFALCEIRPIKVYQNKFEFIL